MEHGVRQRRSEQAVNVGLVANIILAVTKTGAGILGNSSALLADGINSTSDVAYYIAVKIFSRLAGKPPDQEHPYGHRQFESVAAVVVGAFVIATAIAIFFDSIDKLLALWQREAEPPGKMSFVLVLIGAGTVVLKICLTVWTARLGRRTENPALIALAADHRNDVAAALAATLGVLLARAGHFWVDPLAGAMVAVFVLKTGVEILRDSSMNLVYSAPPAELTARIERTLREVVGIEDVEDVGVHRLGPYLVINACIGVNGAMSIAEGDAISTLAEESLRSEFDLVREVHIHVHPERGRRAPAFGDNVEGK